MELVQRSKQGLALSRACGEEELTALLEGFEARYEADRERIETMMRYGQTTRCRMQFLREYFGDDAGDPCQHCDNCAHPVVPVPALQPAGT
jgi:ATP-dependent DNA helicase RecQ